MNPEPNSETLGAQLAAEAVSHVLAQANEYCERERERLSAANEPKVIALDQELQHLAEEETVLQDRIHRAPPIGDLKARRRKARYYWAITALLTVAGFFFSLLAFAPYRLGWKSYLYCIGIAVVTPFCVEKFLETWASAKLMKGLAAIACTAAVAALVLLAVVRGDVLSQEVKAVSAVVFSDGTPEPQPRQINFYDRTLLLLRCVMGLLAIAMEIGAGVALYEARRMSSEGEDAQKLGQELKQLRQTIAARQFLRAQLQKEPSVFANRFWRDFHRGLMQGATRRETRKAAGLLLPLLIFGLALHASAADHLNLVVALDLSQSVAVKSPDQKAEFEKNVSGVTHLLQTVPAGTHVTIIGITDRTFAQPQIILNATLAEDAGYFQEKLAAARTQLTHEWLARSKALQPNSPHTDILGAFLVAADVFRQSPQGRKVLVVFSDMRQESPTLSIERPAIVPANALPRMDKARLIPDLKGVDVWILGADNAGKEMAYWQSLRDFWTAYLQKAGSTLKCYSVLRDPPNLQ